LFSFFLFPSRLANSHRPASNTPHPLQIRTGQPPPSLGNQTATSLSLFPPICPSLIPLNRPPSPPFHYLPLIIQEHPPIPVIFPSQLLPSPAASSPRPKGGRSRSPSLSPLAVRLLSPTATTATTQRPRQLQCCRSHRQQSKPDRTASSGSNHQTASTPSASGHISNRESTAGAVTSREEGETKNKADPERKQTDP